MTDDQLLDAVLDLARRAGEAILEVYRSDFAVAAKEDRSPLTEADLRAHRVIVAGLSALTPALPVLSEESAAAPYDVRAGWSRYWLVDPLDGTREFVKRNGEFTVNIALIGGHAPVLGVVYAPALEVAYAGGAGLGAFKEAGGTRSPIRVATPAASPLRVVGSRSHAGESLGRFLAGLGAHALVSMGSSLKLCLVAEGAADVYPRLGPTSEWDTAAAQAVVEGAGGAVTDTAGGPLRYNAKADLLNPHFLVFGDRARDWTRYL
ncbi:MAG: 3'(2'),5'-bisphosphate nucleotidase CysQ [Gammaproteobacteria bacterium]|jgi:3'(2'), 5'-bisphosphate nucleotidase|nr:3'(2'),5'-bisphosphate nucleotidase CysQ [Gammaproteobacteria bacterium]